MADPKRILLLDTGNEWGGGTNSMIELLKRLDRQRFAVTACFYRDYPKGDGGRHLSDELAAIGIPLVVLPEVHRPAWAKLAKEVLRGLFFWSPQRKRRLVLGIDILWRVRPRIAQIVRLLREGNGQGPFDLLYMNNQPSSNLEGYLAGEQAGVPVVQHCRIEPTLTAEEALITCRMAASIICVSHGVADALATQGVPRERLVVVHNAIDGAQHVPVPIELEPPSVGLVIGTVGQLVARKGVMHLLEAVAALANAAIPVTCLVVGEGPQRPELEAVAHRLGIADRVRFTGFQSQPLAWVAAMDVFVLCSRQEGLPRVILEAMLMAKPVVASDIVGSRELVVAGQTGALYPYAEVPALTEALKRLLTDSDLRRAQGEAGRQRVLAEFSIDAYVAGVSAVLSDAEPPHTAVRTV